MKKSFLAILFCLAFTAMFAQNSPADKANKATERMTKKLNLDSKQVEQVRAAYFEVFVATAELKKSDKATRSGKQHAIQSKFDTDLAKVLTPEQNKKWNETRRNKPSAKSNQKNREMRKANVSPQDRIRSSSIRAADRMANQLELSETQRDQVFEAHKKKLTEVQALRNNNTDRSEMINEKKRINKEYQTTVDHILTAEQIEKRETIRAKRIQQNNNKLGKKPGKKMEIEKSKNGNSNNRMENQAAIYTERMTEKLNLTEDQIDPFHQAFLTRISTSKSTKNMSGSSRKSEQDKIMANYRAALENILTADQLKKLDDMKNNKKRVKKKREE